MRLVDIILVVALVAVVLIVTFAFRPSRKAFELFDGYQVYGGSGSWPGSPQCTDKAIGFQEDTQTPGRYWGWENNQTCAFYTIPQSTGPAPVEQQAQPQPQGGQGGGGKQVDWGKQCGGKGGACSTEGQCVDSPWPGVKCLQDTVCTKDNEWWWHCEKPGGAQGQPQPQPQSQAQPQPQPQGGQGAGGKQVDWGKQCGGKGGACSTDGQCIDSPWPGVQCLQDTVCTKDNEWWWHCEKPAAAQGQPAQPQPQPQPQPQGGQGGGGGPAPQGKQYVGKGQVCGGKGDDCKRVAGASCVDGPWQNFECTGGSVCRQKGDGGWYYECQDPISGGGQGAQPQPQQQLQPGNVAGLPPSKLSNALINMIQRDQQAILNQQLLYDSEKGECKKVQDLLNAGADPNFTDGWGSRPLHMATAPRRGFTECVRALVTDSRTDVNVINHVGGTPLQYAAFNGYLDVIKELVKSPNLKKDYNGNDGWIGSYKNKTAREIAQQSIKDGRHNCQECADLL